VGDGLWTRARSPGNVSLGANYLTRNALAGQRQLLQVGQLGGTLLGPVGAAHGGGENPNNMNGDRLKIVHLLFDKYKAEYQAVFGPLEPALGTDPARFPAAGKPKAAMAADGPWETMTDAIA
jgi:hypothetical protein